MKKIQEIKKINEILAKNPNLYKKYICEFINITGKNEKDFLEIINKNLKKKLKLNDLPEELKYMKNIYKYKNKWYKIKELPDKSLLLSKRIEKEYMDDNGQMLLL